MGGIKSDVDVPFSDILKDLSFGAMMLVDVAKGPLGIGVNGLFARVSPDGDVGFREPRAGACDRRVQSRPAQERVGQGAT